MMDAVQKALRVAKADGGDLAVAANTTGGTTAPGGNATDRATGLPSTSQMLNNMVGGYYQDILQRPGTQAEINQWVNALESNTLTPEQVRQGFLTSSENQVQDLYSGLLQRGTLDPGAQGWISALENKTMTPEQIRAGIMGSAEYQKLNPTTTTKTPTTTTTTPTTTTTSTTTAGATPVDITKQGMPLIYTPPPYKDYGATAAAFRVASGLENLPAPFYTLSPVSGGTPTGGGAGAGAGAGAGGAGGKTTYQQILDQLTGGGTSGAGGTSGTGGTGKTDGTSGTGGTGGTGGTKLTPYVSDVAALYKSYLGRTPTDAEAQNWAKAINSGQLTYNEVVNSIKGSPEATVYSGYQGMLGRDFRQDPAAQQWLNALVKGDITQAQFEAGVKSSPEYAQRQIAQAYQQYLGRTPTAQELSPWAGAVTSGAMGLGDVVNAIATSQEAQGLGAVPAATPVTAAPATAAAAAVPAPVANAVAAAYEQYLGRAPEPGAAEAWAGAIASGAMTPDQVLAAIASSPEAQSYYTPDYGRKDGGAVKGYAYGGGTNYEDLVNAAYRDFLNRESDPAGFKSWLDALTSGQIAPGDFESRFKGAGYEDDIVGAYQSALNRTPTPDEVNAWNSALVKGDMTIDQVMQKIGKSPEALTQPTYRNVPEPDKFSERQGGRMYDIDIGRVERIPELGRMAAPVNVKQAWENSEIARLQKELEDAKKAGTTQARDTSGGGSNGGEGGSNFGGSDASGTAGGVNGSDYGGGSGNNPGSEGGSPATLARGGMAGNNAVDNALRMLKANRG